jgi:protein-tyrosine phosphatase
MTIGILFVCTANICRSPMAEGAFRGMARQAGLEASFHVDSAGTFAGYAGRPPSQPAIQAAARRGYDIASLRARLVKPEDVARFDYVLAMDRAHLADLRWMSNRELYQRLHLFSAFCPPGSPTDVADPFERGDEHYERALDQIEAGCRGLLAALQKAKAG